MKLFFLLASLISLEATAASIVSRYNRGGDYLYVLSTADSRAAGYTAQGPAWIMPTLASSSRAIYLCHQSGGDHFISQGADCEGTLFDLALGSVSAQAGTGLVPLYRFFNPATGHHFESTNANDPLASGARLEGQMGYVGQVMAPTNSVCASGFTLYSGNCYPNRLSCSSASVANGTQSFANGTYGACTAAASSASSSAPACASGSTLFNGVCYANSRVCSIANGKGLLYTDGAGTTACQAIVCNSGYVRALGACSLPNAAGIAGVTTIYKMKQGNDVVFTARPTPPSGDSDAGAAFGVKSAAASGYALLKQCHVGGDHFLSLDASCEGQVLDENLGYVPLGAAVGFAPLYRFGNNATGHHYASMDMAEGMKVSVNSFEGTLGNALPLANLSASVLDSLAAAGSARGGQKIWFAPSVPYNLWTGGQNVASADFWNLFKDGAAWSSAMSHVSVFKIPTQLLTIYPDDAKLTAMFAFLNAHNIKLALEFGALSSPTSSAQCGWGIEGYGGGFDAAARIASKIKSLGGALALVAMDEPLYFGHYLTSAGACRSSIDEINRQIALSVQGFRSVFPSVQIGDIEPLDSIAAVAPSTWKADLAQFLSGFKSANGANLGFFHYDRTWSIPYASNYPGLQSTLVSAGVPLGVIETGTDHVGTDAGWMSAARAHIQGFNSTGLTQPSQIIFQSWNVNPLYIMPESSSNAFASLVNFYFSSSALTTPPMNLGREGMMLAKFTPAYRSCDLTSLNAAAKTTANRVIYAFCLMLSRQVSAADVTSFTNAINQGQLTIAGLLNAQLTSTEAAGLYAAAAMTPVNFVSFAYQLLLFRTPSAAELASGVKLLQGGGTQTQLFNNLLALAEFKNSNAVLF